MKQQKRLEEHENRKQALVRLIQQAEAYKKQVRTIVRDLSQQYKRGIISHDVYKNKIKHTFGENKPLALVKYYDAYIKQYKQELKEEHVKVSKLTRTSGLPMGVFIVLLLILGVFFFEPFLTGFFTLGKTPHIAPVNIITTQDTEYILNLSSVVSFPAELSSVTVTGSVEGSGSVQIYLDDMEHLIYDSTQDTKDTKGKGLLTKLTGLLIAAFNGTTNVTSPAEINGTFKVVDEVNQLLPFTLTEQANITSVALEVPYLEKIEFTALNGTLLGISNVVRGVVEPANVSFGKVYSVDTTQLMFSAATLYATALGDTLYTCPIWDFSLSLCLSSWEKVKALTEQEIYTLPLGQGGTIAFAEAGAVVEDNVTQVNKTTPPVVQQIPFPLKPLDVAVNNFTLGDVAKFDILVRNTLSTVVEGVTAQISLHTPKNRTIANFTSAPATIAASGIKALLAYWDTAKITPGTYRGKLVLLANNKTEEKELRVIVTPKTITTEIVGITGLVVSDLKPVVKSNISEKKIFSSLCLDTCSLTGFNKTNYKIIIQIQDALLNLSSIEYLIRPGRNVTLGNETNVTKEENLTVVTEKIKGFRLNKDKVTFRDEIAKKHLLQRYQTELRKDRGINWERECVGNRCKHTLFQGVKYYENENGFFDAIENALTDQQCGIGEELCVKGKQNKVTFKQLSSANNTVTLEVGNDTLAFEPLQLRYVVNGTGRIISSANPVSGAGVDNIYTYKNIFGEATKMTLTYLATSLKEEIIFEDRVLLQNNNITNENGTLFIDYIIKRPNHLTWYTANNKQVTLQTDEQVIVQDTLWLRTRKGNTIFTLPYPLLFTANTSQKLSYVLSKVAGQEVLSVSISVASLQTASYPIVIDPTVFLNDTHVHFDGYVTPDLSVLPTTFVRDSASTVFKVGDEAAGGGDCNDFINNFCSIRADIDWDFTSIPDNAKIEDVNLTLFVAIGGSPDDNIRFYQMTDNSDTYEDNDTDNEEFHTDMGDGTQYLNQTLTAGGGGSGFEEFNLTQNTDLGLASDIQTILQSGQNNWSIGMRSNETGNVGATASEFTSEEGTASDRPRLTLEYTLPVPTITLNAPANDSFFSAFINVTLNATVLDNEPTIKEIVFYGGNASPPRDQDIIAIFSNASNATAVNYNWTAPVLKADGNTVLLLHFDNRSEFGENETLVFDYSNESTNGTISSPGDIFGDAGAGKLGGGFNFTALPLETDRRKNISFGDQDNLIGTDHTYLLWVRLFGDTTSGTIFSKRSGTSGLDVNFTSTTTLNVRADTTTISVPQFFENLEYVHLALTIDSANDAKIYKNGVLNVTVSGVTITANNVPFDISLTDTSVPIPTFVGNIDEFQILNRTLSDWEILDAFRLKGGTYYWYVNATDASDIADGRNMSEIRQLTINLIPEIALNAPANNSLFAGVGNIILNTTVIERDLDLVTVEIFGSNQTTPDFGSLLFREEDVTNGTTLTYNWKIPVLRNITDTQLLYHLDNRSEFGESDTVAYDFSGSGNNGSIEGGAILNASNELIAGNIVLDGISTAIPPMRIRVPNCGFACMELRDATYMAWIKTADESSANLSGVMGSFALSSNVGFAIVQSGAQLAVSGDTLGVGALDADFFSGEQDTWVHFAGTTLANGTTKIYKNGELTETGVITSVFNTISFGWDFWVGAIDDQQSNNSYNGSLDEVVIINRTLSAAEIKERFELQNGTYYWFVNATDNFTLSHSAQSETRQFTISDKPRITDATINETSPVELNSSVRVNATVENTTGALDTVYLEVFPPIANAFNASLDNTGDEFFNDTLDLNDSGNWVFTFHANDTNGNEADQVNASDGGGNPFITVGWTLRDSFGYIGRDSNAIDGPTFFFDNITSTGTIVRDTTGDALDDDTISAPIFLGFNFTFYDNFTVDRINISNNGFLFFNTSTAVASYFNNEEIPTAAEPNGAAYLLWDDITADGGDAGDNVWNETKGSAPNRYFIAQWHRGFFSGDGKIDIQVVLYENSSDIQYNYLDVETNDDNSKGASATIGIEDGSGAVALQRSFDAPVLSNAYALRFTYPHRANVSAISITPDPANTSDTLNCTFTITDANEAEGLSANITFFNNTGGSPVVFESFNISVTNGTEATQAMTTAAQQKNDQWYCTVIPFDGVKRGDAKDSATITIVNSLPPVPTLLEPPDLNTSTIREPTFKWTAVTDPDGDPVNYTVNLTCNAQSGGGCTAPGDDRLFNVTTANISVVAGGELKFLVDDGFDYNWTVLSFDGENESAFATERTFNITVVVAISLPTDFVDFQSLGLGETNDTSDTDVDPAPLRVQNDGNALIDLNISELGLSLFLASPAPSDAYKVKADVGTVPVGFADPFNQSRSNTSYFNVPVDNVTFIQAFNHTSSSDVANIDVNVTVPLDEPPGAKTSTLLLTGFYTGGTP